MTQKQREGWILECGEHSEAFPLVSTLGRGQNTREKGQGLLEGPRLPVSCSPVGLLSDWVLGHQLPAVPGKCSSLPELLLTCTSPENTVSLQSYETMLASIQNRTQVLGCRCQLLTLSVGVFHV